MTNINTPQSSDELAEAKRIEELEAKEEEYQEQLDDSGLPNGEFIEIKQNGQNIKTTN